MKRSRPRGREVGCESPRFQLCQALVENLRLQNGTITLLAKNGRFVRFLGEAAVNADEPEVMESLQLGPAASPPSL